MGNDVLTVACLAIALVGCRAPANNTGGGAIPASATFAPSPHSAASDNPSATADIDLSDPFGVSDLEAVVSPPLDWLPDPLKRSRSHAHQAWLSPSGSTAYGVIRMNLPLPFIGPDTVLPRFLDQMRETEGEATLIARRNDNRLPGIRFVAEGGQYRLRANLITRGFRAWAVYAGTLRGLPEVPEELQQAEAARDQTRIGTTRVRSKNR